MAIKKQAGFGVIEILLIAVIIGALCFGAWYVWHGQSSTQKSSQSMSSSTTKTPAKSPQEYLIIKEWGVRAPYASADRYSYKISGELATVLSSQLTAAHSECANYGAGQIARFSSTDPAFAADAGEGPTAEQDAQKNPARYTHVGNYYYRFVHDQAACDPGPDDMQNQANTAVKALVSRLQPVPSN